jgi:hypothetical protein
MLTKEEMFEMIRVCFCELVKANKVLKGRTMNYFDPVPNKQMGYNIFIADSATGLCVTIPIPRKNIHCLVKDDFKAIMNGVLEALTKTLTQYPPTGKPPVDYTKLHMRAGRRSSMLDRPVNLGDGTTVNFFRWSSIILPMTTQEGLDASQVDNV